ncbi:hypothetical protein [Lentzea atacamensis]|uniref:hypothetical protein n=1 Tax=Lentzea atacamensis TaxID=531938 RepID=UPI000D6B5276|nr:hypothetical protein [Lentzea atacamensis]
MTGLDDTFADLLRGKDKTELAADAAALSELQTQASKTATPASATPPPRRPKTTRPRSHG